LEELFRDASKKPLPEAIVPIGAGNNQIGLLLCRDTEEFARDRSSCSGRSRLGQLDAMSGEISGDIIDAQSGLISVLRVRDFGDYHI
jgi:hypothetical protein